MRSPKTWVCGLLPLLVLYIPSINAMNDSNDVRDVAEFSRRLAIFSINVYGKLSLLKSNENVVFSPFSIQTCAAMARIGAEGQTAEELDRGLGLVSSNVTEIAESYNRVLSIYEKSNILRIANKIYVMQDYALNDEYNALLAQKFLSSAENIDFGQSEKAANAINGWVEERTNNLIKNLIPPSALNGLTRLVLVNAIHFKGTWVHKFPKHATHSELFYLNDDESVNVPMMNLKDRFRYADLPDLDATALEMPYADSDLSMLVILPKSKTGLQQLEKKLQSVPLSQVTDKLYSTQVIVKFPKFKAEFQVELTNVFKELGMSRMFSSKAEFGKMLQSPESLQVSAVIHKAFIDVNEEGTEAAAATGMVMCFASMPMFQPDPIRFSADHPFYYHIAHKQGTVLFAGKLLKL
ncbi:alaserpin-like isoform X2 [Scaptodrosophila lebanonensis]|uniref:Alaserpin-like isoform X2 n=1 Tax=Drosophila lebanonensis TaxID=7225 RepID=A0A6J2UGC4_DROLE|nr:alaserpin-like isoform X2 [Scaptodrosophila lebanonensis]